MLHTLCLVSNQKEEWKSVSFFIPPNYIWRKYTILDNTLLESYLFPDFLLYLFYRYLNFKHELEVYQKGTWNITFSAACPNLWIFLGLLLLW